MKIDFPYIEIEQPIGTFYMGVLNAQTLKKIVDIRQRGRNENKQLVLFDDLDLYDSSDGVQRRETKNRISKIRDYCSDPDATFPTPIIISIDNGIEVENKNNVFTFDISDRQKIGDVIDGQHRILGISCSQYCDKFNLPVILMFNLTTEEKAYVFSIINSTQTKVSMSLIYDLFDLSKQRSPQKSMHEIVRTLNKKNNSPFFNRLKMLGKKEKDQVYATLSQGFMVTQLLTLVSKDPEKDCYDLKRNINLIPDKTLPLREYFLAERDDVILKIIMNYFSALKEVFIAEWKNPSDNVLWKTTGFGGMIKALSYLYGEGIKKRDLSKDFFISCFTKLKKYMQDNNYDFKSTNFPGGGTQLQDKLYDWVKKANNHSSNEGLDK